MNGLIPILAGEIVENSKDEADILADRDETFAHMNLHDNSVGSVGRVAFDLEDEPGDFIRGEVDVAAQMARTMRSAESTQSSHHNMDPPDVSTGGLDDLVEIPETDDELILPVDTLDDIADENSLSLADLGETSLEAAHASGYFGTESGETEYAEEDLSSHTGAYTDLGAGRSATTKKHFSQRRSR